MALQGRYTPVAADIAAFSGLMQSLQEQAKSRIGAANLSFSELGTPPAPSSPAGVAQAQEQGAYAPGSWSEQIRYGEDGFASNVPRSLIGTESGGNWNAQNNEMGAGGKAGHHGILQFGEARLQDAMNAGIIPQGMTPEQFRQNKAAQVAVSNWHFSNIDSRIKKNGLDRYLGQTVGGIPISMNGMRAMAHLGGFGGLSKFLSSGGSYNPADSFGTTLAAYGKTHY